MESGHRPLGYDSKLRLSRTVFGRINPCRDVRIPRQWGRYRLELGHRGLPLSRCGPHRGFDIEILDRVGLGLNQAVPDRRAGLEDESGGADPALDVCGAVESGGPGTGAQRMDLPGDKQVP